MILKQGANRCKAKAREDGSGQCFLEEGHATPFHIHQRRSGRYLKFREPYSLPGNHGTGVIEAKEHQHYVNRSDIQ